MSDDPRLASWLEATEAALRGTKNERLEALDRARATRTELMRSLEEDPPSEPISQELSERLARAEETLAEMIQNLREELRIHIEELRKSRTAVDGYKPTLPNRPAFISKSV